MSEHDHANRGTFAEDGDWAAIVRNEAAVPATLLLQLSWDDAHASLTLQTTKGTGEAQPAAGTVDDTYPGTLRPLRLSYQLPAKSTLWVRAAHKLSDGNNRHCAGSFTILSFDAFL